MVGFDSESLLFHSKYWSCYQLLSIGLIEIIESIKVGNSLDKTIVVLLKKPKPHRFAFEKVFVQFQFLLITYFGVAFDIPAALMSL